MLLAELYDEDGADYLRLSPGEFVVALRTAPHRSETVASAYGKVRVRGAIDFPLAGVAVSCSMDTAGSIGLNVAVTGTNSRPFVVDGIASVQLDQDLDAELGKLEKLVQNQVSPQRTTIAAAHCRRLAVAAKARRLASRLINELRAAVH